MTNLRIIKRATRVGSAAALAILLAGCSSERGANEMTSYSSGESKTDTPGLFTIPQDQMSHVQIVTVQPSKITRTLRLTGAVAYNAASRFWKSAAPITPYYSLPI